jgi:predicted component of type VI protein secretion system
MPVSTLAVSASPTEEDAVSSHQEAGPILVLDPVSQVPGMAPIVLCRARQFIGRDAECSIHLPDSETSSRHALILRGKRRVILKTFDPQTWLNGLPVRVSLLRDGDLLRVGEYEFRVREATAHELLQSVPCAAGSPGALAVSPSGRLALRRARLSSLKTRLKERSQQIRRECERLHAERGLFEARRAEANIERDVVTRMSQELGAESPCVSSDVVPAPCDVVASKWSSDAHRMQRLFRRAMTPAVENDTRDGSTPFQPQDSEQPSQEVLTPVEHLAMADRVAPEALAESMSSARRQRALREIRASVSSLREVANSSARTAVATYATRKLRGLTASIVIFSAVALLLVVVLFVIGDIESRPFRLVFSALMVDFLILINLSQRIRSIKSSALNCPGPARQIDRNDSEATDGLWGANPSASVAG